MAMLATFAAGLIFGLGLVASGLINPAKVLNFLDVTGAFDPSLAITMAVALAVTGAGYRLILTRTRPWLADRFQLPIATAVDARLVGGAAIFGVGWGLAGFCPGPAIAASSLGSTSALTFAAAMLAGMAATRLATSRPAAAPVADAERV